MNDKRESKQVSNSRRIYSDIVVKEEDEQVSYLKKHAVTLITLAILIIGGVYINVADNVSRLENTMLGALVALTISFLCDFLKRSDAIEASVAELKRVLPTSRIMSFQTVGEVAEQLHSLIENGNHNVDIVLYDIAIRSKNTKQSEKMADFIRNCVDNRRIKLRLAFIPADDSINQRIENYLESEEKKSNSFFAYQESKISFASFMMIDGEYVSVRAPHKEGSKSIYCVVKEEDLCNLYSAWFEMLWAEAIHFDRDTAKKLITTRCKTGRDEYLKRLDKLK